MGLLGEGVGAGRHRHRAHRFEELAGRSHRAGDQDGPLGVGGHRGVGDLTADADAGGVELDHALVEVVELEPEVGAAEGVGQEDVAAGVDVRRVDRADPIGFVDVPRLGRVARLEATGEELGAHRSVDEEGTRGGQCVAKLRHGSQCACFSPSNVTSLPRLMLTPSRLARYGSKVRAIAWWSAAVLGRWSS